MLQIILIIIVILVILALVVVVVFLSWEGPCEVCGSWKNWHDIRTDSDNHQPEIIFHTHIQKCEKCGHEKKLRTVTRSSNTGKY